MNVRLSFGTRYVSFKTNVLTKIPHFSRVHFLFWVSIEKLGLRGKASNEAFNPTPKIILFQFFFFFNSLPNDKILDWSKHKQFTDDNFIFEETDHRKLSKQIEKTVGKGEIARYEQFLRFPLRFEKTCTPNKGLFGKGLKKRNTSILDSMDSRSDSTLCAVLF